MRVRVPLLPRPAKLGEGAPDENQAVRAARPRGGRFPLAPSLRSGPHPALGATFSHAIAWAKGKLMVVVGVLAFFMLLVIPVSAEQGKPYLPRKDSYNVFMLGDSLAGGLGAGMTRLTQDDPEIQMDGRFKEDSGLARPEFYDWNEALPKILESNQIDIAIILIGTNDVQDMREGDLRHVFASPEWMSLYAAAVDRLVDTLVKAGAAVYWASLPPMRQPDYDRSLAQIAAIQKFRVEAKGARYLDIRPQFINSDGSFMQTGPDDTGDIRRLRDPDGVHFMKVGNNKFAKLVLDVLRADITAARSETPAAQSDETAQSADASLRPGTAPEADEAQKPAAAAPAQQTAADRLFKRGEWPPPQAGRFDDFSYAE